MSEIDQLTASSERFTSSECILRCVPSGLCSRESFARAFAQKTRAFTFTLLLQLLLNTTRARARAHSPDPQAREPLLLLFNTTRTTSGPPSTRAAIAVDGGVTDGPRLRQHIVYTIGGTCRYGEATTSELLCLPTNAESNAHIFTGKVSISHT